MKNEKVCISKSVGLIAVIVAILLGVVLLANYTGSQKNAVKSRADERKAECYLVENASGGKDLKGGDCDKCGNLNTVWADNSSIPTGSNGCTQFCEERPGDAPEWCPQPWKGKAEACGESNTVYTGDQYTCFYLGCGENTCKYRSCDQNSSFQLLTECPAGTPVTESIRGFAGLSAQQKRQWTCKTAKNKAGIKVNAGDDCDKCGRLDNSFDGTDQEVKEACDQFCIDHPGNAPAYCPKDWTFAVIDGTVTNMNECEIQDFKSEQGKAVNAEGLETYEGNFKQCSYFSKFWDDNCLRDGKLKCTYRTCANNTNLQEYIKCYK